MAEAGMILQAVGSVQQGIAGYQAGIYNNRVAQVEATNAERDGTVEEARIRESARLAIGQQIAAQGSNGFQMGTGSALDALTQSQINATLDALTARRAAAAKAVSLRTQGGIAKKQGTQALIGGLFGAASSLAGGASDWAAARSGMGGG